MTPQKLNNLKRRATRNQKFGTSLHEAAHAVFALRYGVQFDHVAVYRSIWDMPDDAGPNTLGQVEWNLKPEVNPKVAAMISLAGYAFEEWLAGDSPVPLTSDLEHAYEYGGRIPQAEWAMYPNAPRGPKGFIGYLAVLECLRPEAQQLLMENFDSVVKLGTAVYKQGRMTEAECREVLGETADEACLAMHARQSGRREERYE